SRAMRPTSVAATGSPVSAACRNSIASALAVRRSGVGSVTDIYSIPCIHGLAVRCLGVCYFCNYRAATGGGQVFVSSVSLLVTLSLAVKGRAPSAAPEAVPGLGTRRHGHHALE